jgi:phospholipid/cholesterol/gamma-HCH transport system substrate-binding protein
LKEKKNTELMVGIFMVVGFLCFAMIAVRYGSDTLFGEKGYKLEASFASVSGLKVGAPVEIAGVSVGRVDGILLKQGRATVELVLNETVQVGDDVIASIRTKGLIGEKYLRLTPGISEDWLEEGDEISDTEPVVDIEDLIGKFIYDR